MGGDLSTSGSKFCRDNLFPILAWFFGIGCTVVAVGAMAWLALYTFDNTQTQINQSTVTALNAVAVELRDQSSTLDQIQIDMAVVKSQLGQPRNASVLGPEALAAPSHP